MANFIKIRRYSIDEYINMDQIKEVTFGKNPTPSGVKEEADIELVCGRKIHIDDPEGIKRLRLQLDSIVKASMPVMFLECGIDWGKDPEVRG